MSQGVSCKDPAHKPSWFVTQRNQRCSAFDGYHPMWSEYSCVRCPICPTAWRSKAAFVDKLPNAPRNWENIPSGSAAMPTITAKELLAIATRLDEVDPAI